MHFQNISRGDNCPEDFNVIIEIPTGGDPIKYEVDKDSGALFVDRVLGTAMHYPCNYGYIPHTLCGDGDPVDVMVYMNRQLLPGCVINCRPIGMLKMKDESGDDCKIIAVPTSKVTHFYDDVNVLADLSHIRVQRIAHFFEHYKDLEEGKWVKLDGWVEADDAKREVIDSIDRYERDLQNS